MSDSFFAGFWAFGIYTGCPVSLPPFPLTADYWRMCEQHTLPSLLNYKLSTCHWGGIFLLYKNELTAVSPREALLALFKIKQSLCLPFCFIILESLHPRSFHIKMYLSERMSSYSYTKCSLVKPIKRCKCCFGLTATRQRTASTFSTRQIEFGYVLSCKRYYCSSKQELCLGCEILQFPLIAQECISVG